MEFHGSHAQVDDQVQIVEQLAIDNGGTNFAKAVLEEERNRIWQARHNLHWGLKSTRPGWDTYATDICVPISKLPAMIDFSNRLFAALGMDGKRFCHCCDL